MYGSNNFFNKSKYSKRQRSLKELKRRYTVYTAIKNWMKVHNQNKYTNQKCELEEVHKN